MEPAYFNTGSGGIENRLFTFFLIKIPVDFQKMCEINVEFRSNEIGNS